MVSVEKFAPSNSISSMLSTDWQLSSSGPGMLPPPPVLAQPVGFRVMINIAIVAACLFNGFSSQASIIAVLSHPDDQSPDRQVKRAFWRFPATECL
ncbi:MAG: hypothetical protein AB7F66_14530 [Bacteriovoracia bacterium]